MGWPIRSAKVGVSVKQKMIKSNLGRKPVVRESNDSN